MVATQQETCRVQITIQGHFVDVSLPHNLLIADTVAELIPYLIEHLEAQNKDTSWLRDPAAYWYLTTFGDQRLDEDKTLAEEKVLDGDRLFLTKDDPGEKAAPLIDDVAESLTYHLKLAFASWNPVYAKRISLAMVPAVATLICAALVLFVDNQQSGWVLRVSLAGAMGFIALVLAAISVVLVHTRRDDHYKDVPRPLMLTTYVQAAAAALIVIPRPLGVSQLVVAGSVLLTVSVCLLVLTKANVSMHYAVSAGSLLVLLVGLINFAYRSPAAVIGMQQIALAFALISITSRLALSLAGISMPHVPATGQEFLRSGEGGAATHDAGSLPRDERSRHNVSIFNQKQQIMAARSCRIGLTIGALVVLVASCWIVGRNLDNHHWLIWAFVLVICTCLVSRGKSTDDAREQAIVLIAAASALGLFGAALLTAPAATPENALRGAIALGVLALGMFVATIFAIQERRIASPIVAKVIETIERILFWIPIPMVILAMDLYSKFRAR